MKNSLTFNLSKLNHIALADVMTSSNRGIALGYWVWYDTQCFVYDSRKNNAVTKSFWSAWDMVESISIYNNLFRAGLAYDLDSIKDQRQSEVYYDESTDSECILYM